MKYFLKRILFFSLFTIIGAIFYAWGVERIYYGNKTKEDYSGFYFQANLFDLEKYENYDFILLGSSNAGEIRPCFIPSLKKKSANLSFPGGGLGVQKTYLEFFFAEGNTTDEIIYYLDPVVLFSGYGDRVNYLFDYEPFRLNFVRYILQNLAPKVAIKYLFSKVRLLGFANYMDCPVQYPSMENALDSLREKTQLDGYYDRIDESESQKALLYSIIEVAKAKNIPITFVIPPSLLIEDPNYDNTIDFLNKLKEQQSIPYYDFRTIYQTAQYHKYFRDYVHLNAEGAVHFYDNYLVNVIKK